MDDSEILLLTLCIAFAVISGLLYMICTTLTKHEKKKFNHTSFIIREKELEEVLSKPMNEDENENKDKENQPNGGIQNKRPPKLAKLKGESFYSGKESLNTKDKYGGDDEEEDHISKFMFNEEDEDEEFRIGKSHVLS